MRSFLSLSLVFVGLPLIVCGACGSDENTVATTVTGAEGGSGRDALPPTTEDATADASSDVTSGFDARPNDASKSDVQVPDVVKGPFQCVADSTFPAAVAVPEASAATEVSIKAGVRELLVVADSGHNGAAIAITLPGNTTRNLTLPLDSAVSDDVEGLAWRGNRVYALTSSGAVMRFVGDGQGKLTREQPAKALGTSPVACADLTAVNCGRNYEGLCLRSKKNAQGCDGYAASKAEGKLYCVVIDANDDLGVDPSVAPISLNVAADVLSDCAFGTAGGAAEDALVITTNVSGLSKSYRVNEQTGAMTQLPIGLLLGNNEAIAIDSSGGLYVFDDHQGAPSLSARMSCSNW